MCNFTFYLLTYLGEMEVGPQHCEVDDFLLGLSVIKIKGILGCLSRRLCHPLVAFALECVQECLSEIPVSIPRFFEVLFASMHLFFRDNCCRRCLCCKFVCCCCGSCCCCFFLGDFYGGCCCCFFLGDFYGGGGCCFFLGDFCGGGGCCFFLGDFCGGCCRFVFLLLCAQSSMLTISPIHEITAAECTKSFTVDFTEKWVRSREIELTIVDVEILSTVTGGKIRPIVGRPGHLRAITLRSYLFTWRCVRVTSVWGGLTGCESACHQQDGELVH